MSRIQLRPRRPARPAGMRQKNNDRVRIRNRRYKIKRFLTQLRNSDVKKNGIVVRRMIVSRKTIYPSTRRRQEYELLKPYINIKYLCGKFVFVIKTLIN